MGGGRSSQVLPLHKWRDGKRLGTKRFEVVLTLGTYVLAILKGASRKFPPF